MKIGNRIRYISAITLFTFFINVMLPFYAIYDIPQALASAEVDAGANQDASFFGEKILICTADGFKLVSLADLQSGKEKPQKHPQYQCALCYVAVHGTKHIAPTQEIIFIAYHAAEQVVYYTSDSARFYETSKRGFLTRAPPFIA